MITSIQSPFLEYKLTILRNKKTSNSLFRQTMNEASYLIAAEVLKYMSFKSISVNTPIKKTTGKQLSQQVILVPILRAGLGLLEGFINLLPAAEKGHIDIVTILLEVGAVPDVRVLEDSKIDPACAGKTAYEIAIANGHGSVAQLLQRFT
mgnify:CR=1 FL=1